MYLLELMYHHSFISQFIVMFLSPFSSPFHYGLFFYHASLLFCIFWEHSDVCFKIIIGSKLIVVLKITLFLEDKSHM